MLWMPALIFCCCCCNLKELKKILSGPQISKKTKQKQNKNCCTVLLSTAMNVVLYLVVQNPQQLNTWVDFGVLPEQHGAKVRSFPEIWTGSSWLMEEICSVGSVSQGRGPRGAVQLLSWDVLRIQHDRIPGLAGFQCWPCFKQEIRLQSLLRAPPPLRVLGLDPSGWVGSMEQWVYIVPGWNDLLSGGLNTETAFPLQQGLELCTPSSNFWSLASINFRDPYFTPGVCVVSRRFLVNIVFTLR